MRGWILCFGCLIWSVSAAPSFAHTPVLWFLCFKATVLRFNLHFVLLCASSCKVLQSFRSICAFLSQVIRFNASIICPHCFRFLLNEAAVAKKHVWLVAPFCGLNKLCCRWQFFNKNFQKIRLFKVADVEKNKWKWLHLTRENKCFSWAYFSVFSLTGLSVRSLRNKWSPSIAETKQKSQRIAPTVTVLHCDSGEVQVYEMNKRKVVGLEMTNAESAMWTRIGKVDENTHRLRSWMKVVTYANKLANLVRSLICSNLLYVIFLLVSRLPLNSL